MNRCICFDLEGPLCSQDNAYELMSLFPDGRKLFEIISRYDDILAMEGRKGYEPGDTLSLIVPFLLYHGIRENHINNLAQQAVLVEGARELIATLRLREWEIFCISTSYEQFASIVTQKLGIPRDRVACTSLPLDYWAETLDMDRLKIVRDIEMQILLRPAQDDSRIKVCFDDFFWSKLPEVGLGELVQKVNPVGGNRKVAALRRFAGECKQPLRSFVAIGDSITDSRMLEAVCLSGGLPIAFNANEYALPYSALSLASTHLSDLAPVLDAWESDGFDAVRRLVIDKENAGGSGSRDYFHWIKSMSDLQVPLAIHRRVRRLVREEAGKLG